LNLVHPRDLFLKYFYVIILSIRQSSFCYDRFFSIYLYKKALRGNVHLCLSNSRVFRSICHRQIQFLIKRMKPNSLYWQFTIGINSFLLS